MAQVSIVMGSDSDMPVMAKAAEILDKLGISYEMRIISAHRMPDTFFEYAQTAEERGVKVIIAGAGMAAHLPGMCAALFPDAGDRCSRCARRTLGGRDSLYSSGSDALRSAGGEPLRSTAVQTQVFWRRRFLAVSDPELLAKLKAYSAEMKDGVLKKDAKLQECGYRNYTK